MVRRYILDTSVIIEKIRRGKGVWDEIMQEAKTGRVELLISVITIAELWAGEKMNNKRSITEVEEMIKPIVKVTVDAEVAKTAGELARNKVVVGFDAIISATALIFNAQLVTHNKKHFEEVKGLKLYK
ncbi:MAG: hypothetical protein UU09_C0037G0008 [Microgenomates group bacterium GW2011_GWA2_40_6]|nr:MAG: hypothetical protein UU09_C0037G0008 [Microgenomates group bacterium GW2011_GWA2_40_6]